MSEIQDVTSVSKIMKILTPQYISTMGKSIKSDQKSQLSHLLAEDLKKRKKVVSDFINEKSQDEESLTADSSKNKKNSKNEENFNNGNFEKNNNKKNIPSELVSLLSANGVNLDQLEMEKFVDFYNNLKNNQNDKSLAAENVKFNESITQLSLNAFENIVGVEKEKILKLREEEEKKSKTPSTSEYFINQQKTSLQLQRKLKFMEIVKLYEEGKSATISKSEEGFFEEKQSSGALLNKKRY